MNTKTNIIPSRKGQSMIEAMVALTILMVGLMGVLTLLSRSIFLARVTSDQAKATYLASEGIEIAKSLIDHDVYLGNANVGEGGWKSCFRQGDYDLDFTATTCPLPNYGGDPLYFSPSTDLFYRKTNVGIPSDATPTNFVRKITVTYPTANTNEIDVQSTVTWSTGVMTGQSLTVEDHFYNWHP